MLIEFRRMVERIAKSQPNINSIVENDVYRLNTLKDANYSVFAWQQRQHTEEEDFWIYSLQLFYIDRLTQDGSNELECQNTGIEVLSNIIRTILSVGGGEIELYGNAVYHPFTQKFKDETSGCYVEVAFRVPKDCICEEAYI